ncbi:MAG: hypothetical protein A4E50_01602 [Methanosaeta sp. PtaB.Bin087]|nr:MAG: hypothetical protein A4E50_01602 [Methanosaeta sp. PtaB.Bin087]
MATALPRARDRWPERDPATTESIFSSRPLKGASGKRRLTSSEKVKAMAGSRLDSSKNLLAAFAIALAKSRS